MTLSLIDKLRPLQWLGQNIGVHLLGPIVHQGHLARAHPLLDPKVTDPDMSGLLCSEPASVN